MKEKHDHHARSRRRRGRAGPRRIARAVFVVVFVVVVVFFFFFAFVPSSLVITEKPTRGSLASSESCLHQVSYTFSRSQTSAL